MMADMIYQKVRKYVIQHQMILQDDLVAAGVSGGADSVCLLYLLWRLKKDIPFRLIAVHVNHKVREDAGEDAAYVESLCRELDIPFYLREVDMCGYASQYKLSHEEAGRVLRYQAFGEVLKEQEKEGHGRIAVAHNANDRAETMLFHMFRGSGLEGLSSIRPVRDLVIRPVLCLTREEIESYLKEQGISYCQDSTNDEDTYTRNRIRHHILPYAEKEICTRTVPHMNDLADILMETEDYLSRETKRLFRIYITNETEGELPEENWSGDCPQHIHTCNCLRIWGEGLLTEHPIMVKRVLLYALEQMTPHRKDITGRHIADLAQLLHKAGSKELSLPYGIKAYKEYEIVVLQKEEEQTTIRDKLSGERESYVIEPPAEICVPGTGCFTFTLFHKEQIPQGYVFSQKEQNIIQNGYTKWFDYDKITTSLLLRTRKTGDYLAIDHKLHTQSLKQYMINEKIPKMQRDSMYILADGPHVLWVPAYRTSQYYKVDESTKCILRVQLRGGYHGRTSGSIIDGGRG